MKLVLIGVFKVAEAEKLRTIFKKKEIEIVFNHNEQTCTTGCATTVEVLVNEADMQVVADYFRSERDRILDSVDHDPEQTHQVFDQSKEEAICPACGTQFSTSKTECPDCGLVLG